MKLSSLLRVSALTLASTAVSAQAADFTFPVEEARTWLGPAFWANPLQDWHSAGGRIECVTSGGNRNAALLTHELSRATGEFTLRVKTGALNPAAAGSETGWVGFRIGARGMFHDYRDTAVRGRGLDVGVLSDGRLFLGEPMNDVGRVPKPLPNMTLELVARPIAAAAAGEDQVYALTLTVLNENGAGLVAASKTNVHESWLHGGLALVCSNVEPMVRATQAARPDTIPEGKRGRGGAMRFWFDDFHVSGPKVTLHEERAWGPILFTQHTLTATKRVAGAATMTMTVQMAPVGVRLGAKLGDVKFQVAADAERPPGGFNVWNDVASAPIEPLSRTATFQVPLWNDTRDVPYRISFTSADEDGGAELREYVFEGTVRKNPVEKDAVVAAAFTGNNDVGFPHQDIAAAVAYHEPDILFFTGDQLYEGVGEFGVQRKPLDKAALDYLRKWYIFGWEYKELLRSTPSLCLPDDHDVYHGNIWGAGGKKTDGEGSKGQDTGGYKQPATWVNMVQRTQTSHHPDPFDPTPVQQGITVYYGEVHYGGISFAILEDRKWKTPPRSVLPDADIHNGWAQNLEYDAAKEGDVPDADLLGERQLKFLRAWNKDWSGGTWMKVAVSQTIFANVATLPTTHNSDAGTPRLRVMKPGEYAEGERHVQDHDSNGWPQSGRNSALRELRKAFAFHIAGDQHLGSTIQYGVDAWGDAGFAICVPSVANVWPRRWFPPEPGENRAEGSPRYTGDFYDGFGNPMTVFAVSNPIAQGIEPTYIHDRAPGYGIVRFERESRRIELANWPRWVDPSEEGAKPYPGWPITVDQLENYSPRDAVYLPELRVKGLSDPVVEVLDEASGDVLYTLRIRGTTFRPWVPKDGAYTVGVSDPDRRLARQLTGVRPTSEEDAALDVAFD